MNFPEKFSSCGQLDSQGPDLDSRHYRQKQPLTLVIVKHPGAA